MAVDFAGKEAAWTQLFQMIREQFPYSKMRGLEVRDGAVVSFESVQFTFVFGRGKEPPRGLLPEGFDEQWQRFMHFCQALENGIVGEVHFTDARPVRVSMEKPGMSLAVKPAPAAGEGGEKLVAA